MYKKNLARLRYMLRLYMGSFYVNYPRSVCGRHAFAFRIAASQRGECLLTD